MAHLLPCEPGEPSPAESDMDLLPDDTLLAVFSLLGVKDLLTCRVVCRRWRDLAGHWDAWCRRTIKWRHLRLAPPCCQELYLDGSWEEAGLLVATVACPAKQLHIKIGCSHAHIALASLAIHHQLTIGRLQKLSVYFEPLTDEYEDYKLTWNLRFESVSLDFLANEILDGYKDKKLYVIMKFYDDRFDAYEDMFKIIGPAMHELEIYSPYMNTEIFYPRLENLPNLSRLRTPLSPGIEEVQKSSSIRQLEVYLDLPTPHHSIAKETIDDALEGARSLFRSATCITRLTLNYGNFKEHLNAPGLIESLGESGKSDLTYLEINISDKHKEEIWHEAMQTLPKLEKIHKFVFNDDVYDAPEVVQNIRNMIS